MRLHTGERKFVRHLLVKEIQPKIGKVSSSDLEITEY